MASEEFAETKEDPYSTRKDEKRAVEVKDRTKDAEKPWYFTHI